MTTDEGVCVTHTHAKIVCAKIVCDFCSGDIFVSLCVLKRERQREMCICRRKRLRVFVFGLERANLRESTSASERDVEWKRESVKARASKGKERRWSGKRKVECKETSVEAADCVAIPSCVDSCVCVCTQPYLPVSMPVFVSVHRHAFLS